MANGTKVAVEVLLGPKEVSYLVSPSYPVLKVNKKSKSTLTVADKHRKPIEVYSGTYGGIPVMVIKSDEFGGKLVIRAAGINRRNKRHNAALLRDRMKHGEKKEK